MTQCDVGVRSARDEMRHIVGSSEPDVIFGTDKDQNRGCKKKDKDHMEFLCVEGPWPRASRCKAGPLRMTSSLTSAGAPPARLRVCDASSNCGMRHARHGICPETVKRIIQTARSMSQIGGPRNEARSERLQDASKAMIEIEL